MSQRGMSARIASRTGPMICGCEQCWLASGSQTAPFNGVRGFWLDGLNSTFPAKRGYKGKLHQFAAEFYEAYRSGQAALRVWTNTFRCKPVVQVIEKLDAQPILDRREDYTPDKLPNEIVLATCAVDVQDNRLEYEIVGVGEGEETWGIEYGRIFGDTEQDAVWYNLKTTLQRTFTRADGQEIRIDRTTIDMRHRGKQVRNFVRTCGMPKGLAGVWRRRKAKPDSGSTPKQTLPHGAILSEQRGREG